MRIVMQAVMQAVAYQPPQPAPLQAWPHCRQADCKLTSIIPIKEGGTLLQGVASLQRQVNVALEEVSGERCVVSGERCGMSGERCVVSGAWCVVSGEW